MLQRDFSKLFNKGFIKTFDGKIYAIRGYFLVQDLSTMELKKLSSVYYHIRTVRDLYGNIIGKRKRIDLDLYRIAR